MGIEESIHQTKPFKNPYQKLSVNILYTSGWIKVMMKNWLAPYGITTKQYNVLRILRGAKQPISTCIVRERMIDRMSDVSRMVDRMVAKGWISKSIAAHDKRLVEINIEQAGLDLLDKVAEQKSVFDEALSNLSRDEAELLSRLLDKMRGD